MLLWRHRVENKCSTEANYGRFYPGWLRPSNKREGHKAKRLSQGQKTPNFDVTEAALIGEGPVLAQPWWERTTLTKVQSLPNQPAIYCIYDCEAIEPEPAYVGQSSRLKARAISHARTRWPISSPWLAYRVFRPTPSHVLHELETDVLGWHYWRMRRAPSCQYRSERDRPDTDA